MQKINTDECPTKIDIKKEETKKDEGISGHLLKVLTAEEKEQKIKEARQESTFKKATKVSIRAVAFNFDVLILLGVIFFAGLVGYTYARMFGLTATQITQEFGDYVNFFVYVIATILAGLLKLAAKSGLIAETMQNSVGSAVNGFLKNFGEWIKEIFTPKSKLEWNVLTSQCTDKKLEQK